MMAQKPYLGSSFKFPIVLVGEKPETVEKEDNLKQCIKELLMTPKGTDFIHPGYGSDLHFLQFEPVDEILISLARFYIKDSIDKWERRVRFMDLEVMEMNQQSVSFRVWVNVIAKNKLDFVDHKLNRQAA